MICVLLFVAEPLSRCTYHVYSGSTIVNSVRTKGGQNQICFQNVYITIMGTKPKHTYLVRQNMLLYSRKKLNYSNFLPYNDIFNIEVKIKLFDFSSIY